MQILLELYIDVNSIKDAEDVAHDIHEILGDNGIINSVNVKGEND